MLAMFGLTSVRSVTRSGCQCQNRRLARALQTGAFNEPPGGRFLKTAIPGILPYRGTYSAAGRHPGLSIVETLAGPHQTAHGRNPGFKLPSVFQKNQGSIPGLVGPTGR